MTGPGRVAPDTSSWVRALLRTAPSRVPWDRVVLTGIGITAPVALALILAPTDDAAIGSGALASMGALVVSAMDVGSAGIERVHRMAWAAAMAATGFALGAAVHGNAVLTFVAVIIATLLSGISGAVSATASKSALYFLMFTVTAANADFGLASPWMAPFLFFVGAVWRLVLTMIMAAYLGRAFAPERRAVARVYAALADQLAAEKATDARAAGSALTRALNDAYDVLVAARTELAAHDHRWQTLVAVLNASAPMVDAAIAASERGARADAGVIVYVRGVAAWLTHPTHAGPPTVMAPSGPVADEALAAAVEHVSHVIEDVAGRGPAARGADLSLPAKLSVVGRLRTAARALTSGTELWNSILRLVLCMAVAQALCLAWQLERPYLVMLTVAQVMKPDFGSVFGRAVQRGAGTLIGVAVGALAVTFVPRGEWQILIVLLLAASIPIVMPRNYGLYSIVTTPLAVLLVEIHVNGSPGLVEIRLLDTLLGCAIVLLLGYLPWPQTWHAPRHLAAQVGEIVRAIDSYADVALRGDPDRATARRSVYRRISDVRTAVAQSLAEPPRISAATASWLPEIAALERVADAVTAAATEATAAGHPPGDSAIRAVDAALDDLADAVTSHRAPGQITMPSVGLIAAELTTARAALVTQQKGAVRRARAGIRMTPRPG